MWKNLPKWLKGGLIGLGIGILALLFQLIAFGTAESFKGPLEFLSWILLLLTLPSMFITMLLGGLVGSLTGNKEYAEAFFFLGRYLVPVIYFLIGALIGLVIPKKKI